ncbi:MGMT family protein [bacterium AH-315-P07]|nr:MGMT family protein [bacterium AH-315-P07]
MALKKRNSASKRYENPKNFYEAVYRVVCRIPKGRLMSYGQIATILGTPRASRAVGYAMRACSEDLPWQRVINAKGQISARGDVERPMLQRMLLEDEGVQFDANDSCDLARLRWEPRDADRYAYGISENMPYA